MTMVSGTAADLFDDLDRPDEAPLIPARVKRVGATVVRLLLAGLFLTAAVMKLAGTEFEVRSFEHFGYAPWFMYVIGAVELAGGLMLLAPSLAVLGALAMLPIMVGAVCSHLLAGDPILMTAPSVVVLGLVGWLAYVRRGDLA